MRLLIPFMLLAAVGRAQEENKPYPRSQAEVKAIVQVLAAKRGGSIPNEYIARLRQYRFLCGVPFEDLAWDAEQAELAHHASLVCSKLNQLTHTPARPAGVTDREYELGKQGAGECNLAMGVTAPAECVDGWMDDSDPKNIDRVGHRRWCLNPAMGRSGFGAVGNYAAMYAFDRSNRELPDWDFVAYPARGYMPVTFFGPRHAWSVSPNPAKFQIPDKAPVTITPLNARLAPMGPALRLDYQKVETGGFGSGPAVIFRPASLNLAHDAIYRVEIGLKPALNYVVHFVSLQKIPDSPEGAGHAARFFQSRHEKIRAMGDPVDQSEALVELLENPVDPKTRAAIQKTLAELLKDPAVKREHAAALRYRQLAQMEQKAGKSKAQLAQLAAAYRDLANAYKETRAGRRAAEAFERLKAQLQQP